MGPPPIVTEVLLAHAAFVRSVARAALRGDDLADDAVQETYVAALEHGATRRGPLRPWLGGVARRKAALLVRGRANARKREQRAARPELVDSAADAVARAETARRVCDAVMSLDEPYRAALLLRFYDDLPPRDIAKRLGIPVETVRTRIKRGVARLRVELEEKEGRGWRAALLPLAASVGTRAAVTTGGLVMAKKMVAAVAVVALLGGGLWWTLRDKKAPSDTPQNQEALSGTDTAATSTKTSPALIGTPGDASPAIDRTRDLHGVVVDADGNPIPGASLHVFTTPWSRVKMLTSFERFLEQHPGPTGTSRADGSFALRLPEGSRGFLRVSAPGYASQSLPSRNAGEQVRVVLTAPVTLTLKLEDGEGNPTPGVTIRCIRFPGKGDLFVNAIATSNEEGLAVYAGLPGSTEVYPMKTGGSFAPERTKPIQLPSSGSVQHTIKMVACATITGRVMDADDQPIANATVGLDWIFAGAVKTNAAGEFTQPGWRAGRRAALHVVAPGFARRVVTVGEQAHVDVVLTKGCVVSGRLVGPAGSPLQGVLVAAFYTQSNGTNGPMSNGDTVSDDAGHFRIAGLGDGPHTLSLMRAGLGRRLRGVVTTLDKPHDVGDIEMAPGARIKGTVLDGDGEPVARTEIRLEGPGGAEATPGSSYGRREQTFTDDLGRFHFDDLGTGDYVLTRRDGPDKRTVRVEQPDVVDIQLGIGAETEYRVRVVDSEGNPLVGAAVYFNGSAHSLGTDKTDIRGIARLTTRDRPVGVSVQPADRERHFGNQANWPNAGLLVEVTLDEAVSIRGQLTMAGHRSPAGAYVSAMRADGTNTGNALTDDDGNFVISVRANDGPVDLVVDGSTNVVQPNGRMLIKRLLFAGRTDGVAPGSRNVTIEVHKVPTDRTITFLVLDDEGEPLAGAAIGMPGNGVAPRVLGTTDAAGQFTMSDLAPRELALMVYPSETLEGRGFGMTQINVTPNGQTVTVELPTLVEIRGTVFSASGEPTAGVEVRAQGDHPGIWRTSPKGEFVLVVSRKAFPLTLEASKKLEYLEITQRGTLELADAPSDTVRIDLRATR